jgi:hypothetical protein
MRRAASPGQSEADARRRRATHRHALWLQFPLHGFPLSIKLTTSTLSGGALRAPLQR